MRSPLVPWSPNPSRPSPLPASGQTRVSQISPNPQNDSLRLRRPAESSACWVRWWCKLCGQEEIPVDVLVFATGFDIEGSICSFPAAGREQLLLRDRLQSDPCAYLGITGLPPHSAHCTGSILGYWGYGRTILLTFFFSVPHFPNFFFVLGCYSNRFKRLQHSTKSLCIVKTDYMSV